MGFAALDKLFVAVGAGAFAEAAQINAFQQIGFALRVVACENIEAWREFQRFVGQIAEVRHREFCNFHFLFKSELVLEVFFICCGSNWLPNKMPRDFFV